MRLEVDVERRKERGKRSSVGDRERGRNGGRREGSEGRKREEKRPTEAADRRRYIDRRAQTTYRRAVVSSFSFRSRAFAAFL